MKKKERIVTQIHRRRTVKALSALELEWESLEQGPGSSSQVKTQPTQPK